MFPKTAPTTRCFGYHGCHGFWGLDAYLKYIMIPREGRYLDSTVKPASLDFVVLAHDGVIHNIADNMERKRYRRVTSPRITVLTQVSQTSIIYPSLDTFSNSKNNGFL